jgi:hypothetical protein
MNIPILTKKNEPPKTVDDLTDWAIVAVGAKEYIGKLATPCTSSPVLLEQACEYLAQNLQTSAQGGIQRQRMALPIELMASNETITLYPTSIIWLKNFTEANRKIFLAILQNAEQMREQMRAQDSGILLATQMPKGAPHLVQQ